MTDWLGRTVRDRRSGLTGRVVGIVRWADEIGPDSLVVQPPVRDDRTLPPTSYVPSPAAELLPDPPYAVPTFTLQRRD